MSPEARKTGHPSLPVLALYAGSDLGWLQRLSVRQHLLRCESCEETVASLRDSMTELRREAEHQTLTGYEAIADWPRLEAEMLGNISVGLSAARCVDPAGHRRPWRVGALVTTGLALVFALGWWTHIPPEQTRQLISSVRHWAGADPTSTSGTVMRSSPEGIAVRTQGLSLTMRHPRSAIVSVAGSSAIEARFVDEETGQVTISSVYGQ